MRLRTAIAGRRRWFALAAVVVVTVGAVQVAEAAFPDSDVQTYTGCLTRTGGIGKLAAGSAPAQACGSRETLIHLGGGDITNVIAGEGLTGGGDNGAATLALDGAHSLPQGCTDGQVPAADGRVWDCAAWQGVQVFTTPPAVYEPQLIFAGGTELATLDLPAGTYAVTAAVTIDGGRDSRVTCRLFRDPDENLLGVGVTTDPGDITIVTRVTLTEPRTLFLSCDPEPPGGWYSHGFGIQAIRYG